MQKSKPRWAAALLSIMAVALLAQCTERQVAAPLAPPDTPVHTAQPINAALLTCTGSVTTRTVSCTSDPAPSDAKAASAPAAPSDLLPHAAASTLSPGVIVGKQNVFVTLTSSNIVADGSTFSFDVTVKNLLGQAMGTTDGTTLAPEGVRVFFNSLPTVNSGVGTISVANPDGSDAFTASDQPYFQYNQVLATNATSSAKNWHFSYTGAITFTFTVYVYAPVQYPQGWIDVTPSSPYVLSGNTDAITATVRKFDGTPLLDQTVTWGTGDGTVANVDGSGVATGVAPGSTSITATQGLLSGSTSVSVCPNLAVGGVYTATFPAASNTCLGGGGADEEFTYMPVNVSTSSAVSLTLLANNIQAVTGPPSPDVVPGVGSVAFGLARQVRDEPVDIGDTKILENDRHIPLLARKLPWVGASRGNNASIITPGVPAIGDLMNLNVAQGCSGALDTRVGQVRSISTHAIIVSDTANPAGGFTTAQYDSIALEFDTLAYTSVTNAFGEPTDLDTNSRLILFYTRAVNELSPPASSVVTLGFFTGRDLFSSDPASCPRSNEGEILYMLTPDPTGAVNSNVRTVSFVRGSTVGTSGHELQHAINASRRVYLEGTWNGLFEDTWLNESLSHISEELMFYRASVGLTPRSNIIVTQLTTGPNASRRVAAFNTYANANYGRLRGWLQRPDTSGAFRSEGSLAQRGAGWAFMRYTADRFGGDETAFWHSLINQNTGITNVQQAIGGADPNVWLRDFVMSMYSDDAVSGVSSIYTDPSWSFRSLYTALNGSYQLVPRLLTSGVGLTLSYSRSGGTAYARLGVAASQFATVSALSGGVPPTAPMHVIVMRTK